MLLDRFLPRTEFSTYEDFARDFSIRVPERFNFGFDVVDEMARIAPDRTAMVWCDVSGAEASFTFRQVKEMSDRAANLFRSAGIGKGDAVMLVLKRRYEYWFAVVGLHKLGAVAIPATHLLRTKDITYRCNAADIKMIVSVADPELLGHMDEAEKTAPTLKVKAVVGGKREGWMDFSAALAQASPDFVPAQGKEAPQNGEGMLLYFTSGTTGMPKMVRHDHTYPLGHIVTAGYWHNLRPGDLHLTVADTGWAKAAWGKIYGQWICGAAVFVYDFDKFVPQDMLRVITEHKVTSFCAPPTIYRFFIKEDLSGYDFSHLKKCQTAGEPLNPEVFSQWKKATGLTIREAYGQTETVILLGTYPGVEPRPGSMGKPSPGWEVDVVDEEGRSCGAGVTGQIAVRTGGGKPVGLFMGYYRDEELTQRSWHDGLYYTGDTAWRDEDGYYWFVGRADDLIKASGYRIGPFEVESALLEHPAVLECAVTGVPDPVRGQVVKATIVLAKGHSPSDALVKALQEHVKEVTAPYKYPRIVEFVPELPKTISGKIRRVEIRDKDKNID